MTSIRFFVLSVFLVLLPSATLRAQEAPWQAGVAKVAITPSKALWMSGYGGRTKPAEGKETELWAKVLFLEDLKGHKSILITLDLVGIGRDIAAPLCQRISEKYGIPREAIILSTSHTHCGPVVGDNLRSMYFLDDEQERLIQDYTKELQEKIMSAVRSAIDSRALARLSWGVGKSGFAVNRRTNKEPDVPKLIEEGALKGPVDHDVPVLLVHNVRNNLRAIVFGYACHATVMDYLKWSGDYPGFAQIELEKYEPNVVAMFWAGCGADQNPLPRRKVELAQKYGKQLADSVIALLENVGTQRLGGSWAGAYREIDLPYHELPNREKLVKDTMSTNKYEANRAKRLLQTLETKGSLRGTYPYPIQAWRLGGEVTWVTLGGEVVVDYSLRLKKELGPKTWVMGYANDVMAYIPSARVLKEGGYEGGGAMMYYGLPSIWGANVEELIVDNVRQVVKQTK